MSGQNWYSEVVSLCAALKGGRVNISLASCHLQGMMHCVSEQSIFVDGIVAHEKGFGSRALKTLCAHCDREGITVLLDAVPFSDCPMDAEELTEWYKRHGFEEFISPLLVNGLVRTPR